MPALYWTKTGSDIWEASVRTIFDFKNLKTGETVTVDCASEVARLGFQPIQMPKVSKATKKKLPTPDTRGQLLHSWGDVGVSVSAGKFKAAFWDGKKNVYLGRFDTVEQAATVYEEYKLKHEASAPNTEITGTGTTESDRETQEPAKAEKTEPKYKGVAVSQTPGKFVVRFWDKAARKLVNLGTFDHKLLAAAAYQDHKGNHEEAKRLRDEYKDSQSQGVMGPSEQ